METASSRRMSRWIWVGAGSNLLLLPFSNDFCRGGDVSDEQASRDGAEGCRGSDDSMGEVGLRSMLCRLY